VPRNQPSEVKLSGDLADVAATGHNNTISVKVSDNKIIVIS